MFCIKHWSAQVCASLPNMCVVHKVSQTNPRAFVVMVGPLWSARVHTEGTLLYKFAIRLQRKCQELLSVSVVSTLSESACSSSFVFETTCVWYGTNLILYNQAIDIHYTTC